jgi:microcystin-dependent protein
MARNYSSIAEVKTLADNVPQTGTNSDKVTVLPNVTGLPTVPFVLVLNPDTSSEEAVLATSLSGTTYTVTRNIEGGGLKTHTAGQTVKHMIVGSDLQIVHDHFSDNSLTTGTAHGVSGGVVGRTSSQTLTNKTINLTDNTLTGTTAQFNTALSDANFATTALLEARMPVGAVNMWVTGTAPSGWLICDGTEKAIADYSALSSVIGTTYGALTNGSGGTGTTHFRLPDLRGRVPMGAGTGRNVADSANLTARTLGAKVSDDESVTLTALQSGLRAHGHSGSTVSISDPGHIHYQSGREVASTGGGAPALIDPSNGIGSTQTGTATTGITASTTIAQATAVAAQDAHNNVQPSTVINFIIKF